MAKRVGPHVRLVLSCDGCTHLRRELYDEHYVQRQCWHPDQAVRGIETSSAPKWCPLRAESIAAFVDAQKARG
jgi:hypothetical protein